MDKGAILELIDYILESLTLIEKRIDFISAADDFLKNEEGIEKLDAISMRLQSIGEAIKNIHKNDRAILLSAADDDYWSSIIRLREIISHHYIDIDAEIIFDICKNELKTLSNKVREVKNKLIER